MGNKNDAKKRRKRGPIKFTRRCFRGRHTSNIADNSENTEEENVNIPATPDTGHPSESASSRKLKTTVVASTPESGIADAFHYLIIDSEILQTIKRCWKMS